jgi:RNA polymerase sigma factor (sigma-70 family)
MHDLGAQQDADLVQRYLGGEPTAVAMVDGWLARAASPFRRGLAAEWEDVLQEIRMEVVRLLQAGQFRGDSRLKTYLWQVSCHTCLDVLRRLRRRTFVGLESAEAVPARGASPLDSVLQQEGGQAALRAFASLSPECRELWRMILSGLSYRDIGRQLGVSEGALRVRAHRCRKCATEAFRAATAASAGQREAEGAKDALR